MHVRPARAAGPSAARPHAVRRAACGTAAVALALLGLVGCARFSSAQNAPAGTTESVPAAPGQPGQPNATADADTAVLAAYRGYWNSAVSAWTQGSLTDVPLGRYATGPADSAVRSALQTYQADGVVTHGQPLLDPSVTALNLSASPYTATITDCVDETGFYKVHKSTGVRVAGAPTGHHPAVYQARYDGGWVIVSGSVDPARAC
ncbi:hypothetical protein ABH931_007789 [Streptacidiphilus sp. MAP12-33]|uniref:hypothetical protein n=1 Tax=Streptacidiphilus sp. MAP12-33 TaxID=3156266 RepID=UPI003511F47F